MVTYPADDRRHILQNPGQGQRFDVGGMVITIKAAASAPTGAFTLFEIALPPHQSGPAAHFHQRTTEWFYILSGTLAFTLDDETVLARPGSSVLVTPGVIHTVWNPAATPASLLGFRTRADFAEYLAALEKLMTNKPAADLARLIALATQYDQYPGTADCG
ncbi:MAG: cupin domain-containing protein [Caldilineaceae bacterium]